MVTVTLRKAVDADMDYVQSLLEANALPVADVREQAGCFFIATVGDGADEQAVGCGGLEIYGPHGLLRSIVVEESVRGEGYGHALCDELEARAQESGVEELYLLTTTAASFFGARGYEKVDRTDVPERIRRTTEFADLCPGSATCLWTTVH